LEGGGGSKLSAGLLALILVAVFAASALNLVLGGGWVVVLLAIFAWRRRARAAAWLVLGLTLAVGAGAERLGWLGPPPAASYEVDEWAWLRGRLAALAGPEPPGPPPSAQVAARTRLTALRAEELEPANWELEQRAGAVIASARQIGRWRGRAPGEVTLAEEAARRLALTLTAPEFSDLDGRRARLVEWLTALDAQLAASADPTQVAQVSRGLDPAALASVSLRAVREDLTRAEAALVAAVRAVSGATVAVRTTARLTYDEERRESIAERHYAIETSPPLRLVRLDVAPLRRAATEAGVAPTLTYAADGAGSQAMAAGSEIVVAGGGAMRVVIADRRARVARPVALQPVLRPIPFYRLDLGDLRDRPVTFLATVALDDPAGPGVAVALPAAPARLEGVGIPRWAFHYASRPGDVAAEDGRELWRPMDAAAVPGEIRIELAPASVLVRNPVTARLRPYLYTPNFAATIAGVGLAALAVALVPRRRASPPAPGRS
jgi:hypothetical protein